MAAEPLPSDQNKQESYDNENDEWRKFLIALLFLLFSFGFIFLSSQIALLVINRDRIEAGMRSQLRADYGRDPAIALAPLDENIVVEAAQDEAMLALRQTPISQGLAVVILPNPLPTPSATLIALLPTPTSTPTPTPTPVAAPPEVTGPPPPTPIAPTSTAASPTSPPPPTGAPPSPTSPPPTAPPTAPPPTALPPTSPPPTSPPPTDEEPSATPPISPRISFSLADYNVSEGAGSATITVVLNRSSSRTITVNYATSDLTATAGRDYTATSGVLTFVPGQTSQSFAIPISADGLTNEPDEQLRLALNNPVNAELGAPNLATLTIEDNDGQPAVRFSAAGFSAAEGDGQATVAVELSAPSAVAVTVVYSSTDITAVAGVDYTGVNGILTIPPEQVSITFDVPLIDDNLTNEPDKDVQLTLSNPLNAAPGTPSSVTLTIADDDGQPAVQFNPAIFTVTEGNVQVTITVELSAPSAVDVTVEYASSDVTATAGADYTDVNGILTFPAEQLSATFAVPILEDNLANEGDETVELTLSTPANATIGTPNLATLTIVDNDLPPEVQFEQADFNVAEDGGPAVVTVVLSAPSAMTVTVDYASDDVTAIAGADYEAVNNTLTFPPTQTSLTFTVSITDDSLPEAEESLTLTLSNPTTNATLGATNPATLTINDNDRATDTCPGLYPAGQPNIGPPDGEFARIGCDVGIIIDLGASPIVVTDPADTAYELVYYEARGVDGAGVPLTPPQMIFLDLVTIELAADPAGTWYPVFIWGDTVADTNTNLMRSSPTYTDTGVASDNDIIETPPLVGPSGQEFGIEIDVDNPPTGAPPNGNYRYVRIYSPPGGDTDGPEIDALQVLP